MLEAGYLYSLLWASFREIRTLTIRDARFYAEINNKVM